MIKLSLILLLIPQLLFSSGEIFLSPPLNADIFDVLNGGIDYHKADQLLSRITDEKEFPSLDRDTVYGYDYPDYTLANIESQEIEHDTQRALVEYAQSKGFIVKKLTDPNVKQGLLPVICRGESIVACIWGNEIAGSQQIKRLYENLITQYSRIGIDLRYEHDEGWNGKVYGEPRACELALLGILAGKSLLHTYYDVLPEDSNLEEYGLPGIKLKAVDTDTVELLCQGRSGMQSKNTEYERMRIEFQKMFGDAVRVALYSFIVDYYDYNEYFSMPALIVPRHALPYVVILLKMYGKTLIGNVSKSNRIIGLETERRSLLEHPLIRNLSRVNGIPVYETVSRLFKAGLDPASTVKNGMLQCKRVIRVLRNAGLDTAGIQVRKSSERIWELSMKGENILDIEKSISDDEYLSSEYEVDAVIDRTLEFAQFDAAKDYHGARLTVRMAVRGEGAYYRPNEFIKSMKKRVTGKIAKFCEKEFGTIDRETMYTVANRLRDCLDEATDECVFEVIRNSLVYISHRLKQKGWLDTDVSLHRFFHQEVAAQKASDAAEKINAFGLENIRIESVSRIEGKFKDGSQKRVYVLETNIPFDAVKIQIIDSSYKKLQVLVITDEHNTAVSIAMQWPRRLKEDSGRDMFYLLQGEYAGVLLPPEHKERITALRSACERLFSSYMEETKDIPVRPYYLEGPMVNQGELETGFDRELKEFLGTNPVAQHMLALPEYQMCGAMSFSPGIFCLYGETRRVHPFGTEYNLPAGYFAYNRGFLRSLLERTLYAPKEVIAIHEMAHHITRLRYLGFVLPIFTKDVKTILEHLKKDHTRIWKENGGESEDTDWEEFLNTLLGFQVFGSATMDFYCAVKRSEIKKRRFIHFTEPILSGDIELLDQLGITPHEDERSFRPGSMPDACLGNIPQPADAEPASSK